MDANHALQFSDHNYVSCLKPFVTGFDTGYGAFDTEHVATETYGSCGFNEYKSKKKLLSSLANGLRSLGDGVNKRKSSGVDGRLGQALKDMKRSLDPTPRLPNRSRWHALRWCKFWYFACG